MFFAIASTYFCLLFKPKICSNITPSFSIIMVGTLLMEYFKERSMFESTSKSKNSTLGNSCFTSSKMGVSLLQGPHHSAEALITFIMGFNFNFFVYPSQLTQLGSIAAAAISPLRTDSVLM